MEFLAIGIGIFFIIHLLVLLVRRLSLDNHYNQNISITRGKVVGDESRSGEERIMCEIGNDTNTMIVGNPKLQVTSSFTSVYIRLYEINTGSCIEYSLENSLIIGRNMSGSLCEIQLSDEMVSQKHCCLYRQGESIFIQDLGSTNHTFLNGCKVEGSIPLSFGDVIKIGKSCFQFQCYM